jgi:hypothetical protein
MTSGSNVAGSACGGKAYQPQKKTRDGNRRAGAQFLQEGVGGEQEALRPSASAQLGLLDDVGDHRGHDDEPARADERDDGQIGEEDRELRAAAGGGHPPEEARHERQIAEDNPASQARSAGCDQPAGGRQRRAKARASGTTTP